MIAKEYAAWLGALASVAALGCGGGNAGGRPPVADSVKAQATTAADTTPSPRAPHASTGSTILFAGTSLTAGLGLDPDSAYPQLIQRMLDSAGMKFEVVNAGVSGETSSALLHRLDWLLREPFGVIVIETGANDGLRGIPIETMEGNIQKIIEEVRARRPAARIALMQMEAPPNMGTAYTQRFRAVFPELARRNGVVLLPFLLEGVAGVRDLNQGDGIHPNYVGERIVARNVWKGLRPLLQ